MIEEHIVSCVFSIICSLQTPNTIRLPPQPDPAAWLFSPACLLKGSGIYCNAIVFDGIGPVLTLMMPSSLNWGLVEFGVITAQLEAMRLVEHV